MQDKKPLGFIGKSVSGSWDSGTIAWNLCSRSTFGGSDEEVFKFAKDAFRSNVSIVVNCAGLLNEQTWKLCIQVNLIGSTIIARTAIEQFGKHNGGAGGCVILIGSVAGMSAAPHWPVYSASKHGVIGLTRGFGSPRQFKHHGIRFNCLSPAYVDTPMTKNKDAFLFKEDFTDSRELAKLALPPADVAAQIVKLTEDENQNGDVVVISTSRGVEKVEFPPMPLY
ncbi:hypothetical protein CAPTEDRAFT_202125 [Capitella teleta]|uniref:15-hydroxyprostaglandin dehydrogenase [NAD(+)] n=1 Tax=Capitella teleta TaxID=283909 RepID=R7UA87_CAPTE|nr:hypothetical protein CAPTEDRAFT_202125 [Capitella teleta]|eukprot:ELU00728.1 hypothetical protein CAPTEDRAFT_202125 [Capitella teleta]